MKIKEIIRFLEEKVAPPAYAESFDNVGLLVGNAENQATGVLVTLDTLENVVQEAIQKNCNLIVSFHPIIFSGLKSLTGKNYVERAVIQAIKNDVAIYAIHTGLDNSFQGVNARICDVLGLENRQILIPQKEALRKLVTYVPENQAEMLREALFAQGAGNIGNYSECSFNLQGEGTFKGNEKSNPFVGQKNHRHTQNEQQINVVFPKHLQNNILTALRQAHPYEEIAYEVYTLTNVNPYIGLGMVAELPSAMKDTDFLLMVKEKMHAKGIRHSAFLHKEVKKIAVLGGSGAFAIDAAIASQADVYITSDIKYHEFFKAENKILLADIGHYESEQFTKNLIVEELTRNFPNFAVQLSTQQTNPINYL